MVAYLELAQILSGTLGAGILLSECLELTKFSVVYMEFSLVISVMKKRMEQDKTVVQTDQITKVSNEKSMCCC